MTNLSVRWSKERFGGLHHAEVFVVGKWRLMSPACRRPRTLRIDELHAIQHSVSLNTGGSNDFTLIQVSE